jgi:hypothetical protein
VVRIVLDDLNEKERKELDSEGPMPSSEPFLSENNKFYNALLLSLLVMQIGKKSFKEQNENSDSDDGEIFYQPINQNIANAITLNAYNISGVFLYVAGAVALQGFASSPEHIAIHAPSNSVSILEGSILTLPHSGRTIASCGTYWGLLQLTEYD